MPAIKLLPYEQSFLSAFIARRSQPLTVRYNPLKKMSDDEIARMLQAEGTDLCVLEKCESYRWFISADGEVVETVSLKNISHSMSYGEIGYGLSESHHGKGIAILSIKLLVDKIFNESPLRRLIAYVHEENQASRRVLEKLGFQEEGLLREHYVIAGAPVNEVLYGLLKREWMSANYRHDSHP
jgi:[ribosomal protein S5]-alanine N-acetyltransferase